MLQPWGCGTPPESDVDLVRNLGRDLMDRQGREQADDTLGNAETDRDQVGASERREVRETVEPAPELLQHPAVVPQDGRRLGKSAFSSRVEFDCHG